MKQVHVSRHNQWRTSPRGDGCNAPIKGDYKKAKAGLSAFWAKRGGEKHQHEFMKNSAKKGK